MRTCPLNFRFSGQGLGFRPAKSRGAARKTNISRQYRNEVTFQSSTVLLFRVKNREILVARPRYRVVYYSKTTRFPETPPFFLQSPPTFLCRSDRSMCAGDYFASAHSCGPRDNGSSKYLFFGPVVRAADLQGDRLISLKATMNRTERRSFDFGVKRPRCRVLGP